MRTLVVGVDSGTQSTKVLVVNARDGSVVGQASKAYGLIPGLPPGAKEQHPRTWRAAAAASIKEALKDAHASAGEVMAIGVSGQQHGFVPLDKEGEVDTPPQSFGAILPRPRNATKSQTNLAASTQRLSNLETRCFPASQLPRFSG